MPKVVIQVAKCEPATIDAKGRKFSSKIYDTAGTKYTIGKLAGMVQEGGWYEIVYEDTNYQGNPFKQIVTVNPTTPMTTSSAVLRGPDTSQAPAGEVVEPRFRKQPTNPIDAQRIFVCGAVNAALHGRGLEAITATELGDAIDVLELVWRSKPSLGGELKAPGANSGRGAGVSSPQTQAHPDSARDMDDEIPF